jgi:RNase P/RNase MRP subunit POP5
MRYRIPKSMREKKRYLKVRLISDRTVSQEEVRHALWSSLLQLSGELGAAKTQVWISSWEEGSREGYVRCAIHAVDTVIVALKLITDINKTPATFVVEGVSGTIKSLRTAADGPKIK